MSTTSTTHSTDCTTRTPSAVEQRLHRLAQVEQGPDGMLDVELETLRAAITTLTEQSGRAIAEQTLVIYLKGQGSAEEPGPVRLTMLSIAAELADTTRPYKATIERLLISNMNNARALYAASCGHRWEAAARYGLCRTQNDWAYYIERGLEDEFADVEPVEHKGPQLIKSLGDYEHVVYYSISADGPQLEDEATLLAEVNGTMGTTHTHYTFETCGDYEPGEAPEDVRKYGDCVYYTYYNIEWATADLMEYAAVFYTPAL
jgi:hypothetical protein